LAMANVAVLEGCKLRRVSSRSKGDGEERASLNFGGACQLRGPWVTAAMESANELRGAIYKLQAAMAKCNKLPPRFADELEKSVENVSNSLVPENVVGGKQFAGLTGLPSALGSALKYKFMTGNEGKQAEQYFDILMSGKAMEASVAATPEAMAAGGAANLVARYKMMASEGVKSLDMLMTGLQAGAASCPLDGGGNAALRQVLMHSTRTLGAFLTGDSQLATRATSLISKMLTLYDNAGINSALADLDRSEFMLSLSCLIESTSTSYCSMRDAQDLMASMRQHYGEGALVAAARGQTLGVELPDARPQVAADILNGDGFEGYYLLSRVAPTINKWLMDLQVGVEPILKSDGTYQQTIAGIQTGMIQSRMALLSEFNDSALTIRRLSATDAISKALVELVARLASGLRTAGGTDLPNFYTMALPDYYIPYYLVGLKVEEVPDKAKPSAGGSAMQIDFSGWAQTLGPGGGYQPFFLNSRDNALAVIQSRLRSIIDLGSSEASKYSQARLKLDPALVVASAVNSVTPSSNVRLGLGRIHRYLTRLSFRVAMMARSADPADQAEALRAGAMADMITETRERVKEVMSILDTFAAGGLQRNNEALAGMSDADLRAAGLDPAVVRASVAPSVDPMTPAEQQLEANVQSMEAQRAQSRLRMQVEALRELGARTMASMPNNAPMMVKAAALGLNVVSFRLRETPSGGGDPTISVTARDRYLEVVNKIYGLFEVLILRESYLSGRMTQLVAWDMAQTIRRRPQMLSERGAEFLRAGDMEMLSSYLRTMGSGADPAQMWDQMSMAYKIHMTNFSALSKVFQYHLKGMIEELDLLVRRPGMTELEKRDHFIKRSMEDSWYYWRGTDKVIAETESLPGALVDWVRAAARSDKDSKDKMDTIKFNGNVATNRVVISDAPTTYVGGFLSLVYRDSFAGIRRSLYPELYPMPTYWSAYRSGGVRGVMGSLGSTERDGGIRSYADDKYGSYERLLARLCIQSLALADPTLGGSRMSREAAAALDEKDSRRPNDICKGVVLKSYWSDGQKNNGLNVYYDEIRSGVDKSWTHNFRAGSQYPQGFLQQQDNAQVAAKCALYDSSRRNAIHWMNLDPISDAELPKVTFEGASNAGR
jgi:hypothetical protein